MEKQVISGIDKGVILIKATITSVYFADKQ